MANPQQPSSAPAPEKQELQSFHFDIGNSNEGPLGCCARVKAFSEKEAVEILKEVFDRIAENDGISYFDDVQTSDEPPAPGLEYLNVYVNSAALTAKDIDMVDDIDTDDEEDEDEEADSGDADDESGDEEDPEATEAGGTAE